MNVKAEFKQVTEHQKERIEKVRNTFSDIYNLINDICEPSRETSLAMTKLEEAQFWAIKGISREI